MTRLLYNMTETAEVMGTSRDTISDMVKAGELRAIPWRGSRKAKRISRAEIERYIEEHTPKDAEDLRRLLDKRRAK